MICIMLTVIFLVMCRIWCWGYGTQSWRQSLVFLVRAGMDESRIWSNVFCPWLTVAFLQLSSQKYVTYIAKVEHHHHRETLQCTADVYLRRRLQVLEHLCCQEVVWCVSFNVLLPDALIFFRLTSVNLIII